VSWRGKETVAAVQHRKLWKVGKRCIRSHKQHRKCARNREDVPQVAQAFLTVNGTRKLADDRFLMRRHSLHGVCQEGDAEKQDNESDTHRHQRFGGIFSAWLPEKLGVIRHYPK
jgi:hypothetical protein